MTLMRTLILRAAGGMLMLAISAPLLPQPSHAAIVASSRWPTVAVDGNTTSWTLQLLSIRSMYRVPNTQWVWYSENIWQFWVLNIRMTNTGHRAADLEHDLTLAMKVLPQYQQVATAGAVGFTMVTPDKGLKPLVLAAARQYGGALAWTVTQPGHTTDYSYLIGGRRGYSHFGFYKETWRGDTFLFNLGI